MVVQPAHETPSGIPLGLSRGEGQSPSQGGLGVLKGIGLNPFENTLIVVLKLFWGCSEIAAYYSPE